MSMAVDWGWSRARDGLGKGRGLTAICSIAEASFFSSRATIIMLAPLELSSRAAARPMPWEAPVMRTVWHRVNILGRLFRL